MTRSYYSCSKILGVALLAGLWTIACSSDEGSNSGTGGSTAASTGTGGKSSTAAKTSTGGSTSTAAKTNTGGSTAQATATGGAGTGGASSTATGTKPTGGTTATSTSGVGGVGVGGTGTGTGTHAGGTTGVGGITSTGGNTGDAGGDASTFSCAGCLKLYVPLAAASTGTDFEEDYGTSTTIDITSTTVTAHVYVDTAGNAGGLRIYAKNDSDTSFATVYSTWANLADLDGKWTDIMIDGAAIPAGPTVPVPGTFDKTIVRWIGFNVAAGDAFDGGVIDPVTVYVDWIKFTPVTNPSVADDMLFTTGTEGFAINTYNSPVTGSTVTWFGG